MKLRMHWQVGRQKLRYPIARVPRTAVLVDWVKPGGPVRVFPEGWCPEAEAYAPESIAATWPQWEQLIGAGIAYPELSAIVLAAPGEPLLTMEQRDRLWRAFHVPVFEQILTRRGQLVAAECEAHDGLHVEDTDIPLVSYKFDEHPCACGKKTPRIVPAQPTELVRAAAAYAR